MPVAVRSHAVFGFSDVAVIADPPVAGRACVAHTLLGGPIVGNRQVCCVFADGCSAGHHYLLFLRVLEDLRPILRLTTALAAALALPSGTPFRLILSATCDHCRFAAGD